VRADLRPLVRVEEALEQCAEDGRIDLIPFHRSQRHQKIDLTMLEFEGPASVEQAAIETRDVLDAVEAARLHGREELVEHLLGPVRPPRRRPQEFCEIVLGQQLHVLGEEAEDKLIDEMRDGLAVWVAMLQALDDGEELCRGFGGQRRARALRPRFTGSWKTARRIARLSASSRSSSDSV